MAFNIINDRFLILEFENLDSYPINDLYEEEVIALNAVILNGEVIGYSESAIQLYEDEFYQIVHFVLPKEYNPNWGYYYNDGFFNSSNVSVNIEEVLDNITLKETRVILILNHIERCDKLLQDKIYDNVCINSSDIIKQKGIISSIIKIMKILVTLGELERVREYLALSKKCNWICNDIVKCMEEKHDCNCH